MVKRKLGQTTESSAMEVQMHQPGPEISDLAYSYLLFRAAIWRLIKEKKICLTIETESSFPSAEGVILSLSLGPSSNYKQLW